METKIVWYAAGGGIAKTGPYSSQIEAYSSLRLIKELVGKQRGFPFPKDIVVWPEEEKND